MKNLEKEKVKRYQTNAKNAKQNVENANKEYAGTAQQQWKKSMNGHARTVKKKRKTKKKGSKKGRSCEEERENEKYE